MHKVYICHPFQGNKINYEAITQLCRNLAKTRSDIVPISPVHAFGYLDDNKHRKIALMYCLALLEACDEVWVYDEWQESEGCCLEVGRASELGMPIVYMDD